MAYVLDFFNDYYTGLPPITAQSRGKIRGYGENKNSSMKTLDLELTPGGTLYSKGDIMKIAEVSEKYGISSDTLRYYERIGLFRPVNRSASGIRDYNETDLKRVEFIKCMRSAGLPIETLIEYVGLVQQGNDTINARKEILKEQRELLLGRMDEMQKTLDLLNHKMEVYENAVLKKEQEMLKAEDLVAEIL
jgi:MerR family transcriptional regulator, aldehyde-responsive regulator